MQLKEFEGIKYLKVDCIEVEYKFLDKPPKDEKVRQLIQYYKKQGELDKPIVVSCVGNRYVLADKYLRLVVAKELGLEKIPAEMGSKEETAARDHLRTVGNLVWNKKEAEVGEIVSTGISKVTIRYDSGEIATYDIHKCLNSGTIIPL